MAEHQVSNRAMPIHEVPTDAAPNHAVAARESLPRDTPRRERVVRAEVVRGPDAVGAGSYPLSTAQARWWAAQQLAPEVPLTVAMYLDLAGSLDLTAMVDSARRAARELESPQLRFHVVDGCPRQYVDSQSELPVLVEDVRAEAEPFAAALARMESDHDSPLDPCADALTVATLFVIAPDRHLLYLRSHHMVLDGVGAAAVLRRTGAYYRAAVSDTAGARHEPGNRSMRARRLPTGRVLWRSADHVPAADAVRGTAADSARRSVPERSTPRERTTTSPETVRALTISEILADEDAYRSSARAEADRAYWLEKRAGADPTGLAGQPAAPSPRPHRVTATLDAATAAALAAAQTSHGATFPELTIAAFACYLARMSGSDEASMTLPVTARPTAALRRSAGSMSNVVPLRLTGLDTATTGAVIAQVRSRVIGALRHQRYPYEDIQRDRGQRTAVRGGFGPVVNVLGFVEPFRLGPLTGQARLLSLGPVEDLLVNGYQAGPDASCVSIDFQANPARYSPSTLAWQHRMFLDYFAGFLAAGSDCAIADLAVPVEDSVPRVIPGDGRLLPDLLRSGLSDISADAVAVRDGARTLTYRELDESSARWARELMAGGARPGEFVAVVVPRSLESVLALWAVSKTGAGFVPVDPADPVERIATIIADSGARQGLTITGVRDRLPCATGFAVKRTDPGIGPVVRAAQAEQGARGTRAGSDHNDRVDVEHAERVIRADDAHRTSADHIARSDTDGLVDNGDGGPRAHGGDCTESVCSGTDERAGAAPVDHADHADHADGSERVGSAGFADRASAGDAVRADSADRLARENSVGWGVAWLVLDDDRMAGRVGRHSAGVIGDGERPRSLRPGHPAYLIYTSGTSGAPKGVVVTHRGLGSLTTYLTEHYGVQRSSVVLHAHAPSFDAHLLELLAAFAAGAVAAIAPASTLAGAELIEVIRATGCTHFLTTPAVLAGLSPDEVPGLEAVVVGGEACPPELVATWAPHVRLFNGYGPTETTVMATQTVPMVAREPVTIGHALPGVRAVVLNSRLTRVPPGGRGELYLGGPGVAEGYRDDPERTSTRFVADPFGVGDRLYRTGDLVGAGHGGAFEFFARVDGQLRLRGRRVEPGEIESVLLARAEIAQAAVAIVNAGTPHARLVGYVVVAEGRSFDARATVDALRATLPAAMVPSVLVEIDRLPVSAHGKLDRSALPSPTVAPRRYRAPETATQRLVAERIASATEQPRVGLDDDFFELGGNSLSGVAVSAELAAASHAPVTVRWLYSTPTVGELAAKIDGYSPDDDGPDDDALGVLLTLRRNGTREPLFCVHSAVPLAWCYAGLAGHITDRPVYGLQAPNLTATSPRLHHSTGARTDVGAGGLTSTSSAEVDEPGRPRSGAPASAPGAECRSAAGGESAGASRRHDSTGAQEGVGAGGSASVRPADGAEPSGSGSAAEVSRPVNESADGHESAGTSARLHGSTGTRGGVGATGLTSASPTDVRESGGSGKDPVVSEPVGERLRADGGESGGSPRPGGRSGAAGQIGAAESTPAADSAQRTSIDELADAYVEAMVLVQPDGPYHLLGWSLGGQIAHAIAIRLRARGAAVAMVAMLDSVIVPEAADPPPVPRMRDLVTHLLGDEPDDADQLPELTADEAAEELARAGASFGSGLTAAQLTRLHRGYVDAVALAHGYRPGVFDGDLVYFSATRGMTELFGAEIWRRFVTGELVEHPVDATHAQLTNTEVVARIGPILAAHLERLADVPEVGSALP
ncbi:hypothetical protein GCM10023318_00280 [Nocardia callitridis]|uniref:Carrier domain-containing protein n=1 Tax=Nocardia callitridis TaxID=648753 RepID=A0ABP9JTH9_9NOCA